MIEADAATRFTL